MSTIEEWTRAVLDSRDRYGRRNITHVLVTVLFILAMLIWPWCAHLFD
jgi:hypothetical protein